MILLFITAALAGAFGIEMGTPIASLDHADSKGENVYLVSSVPKPHAEFITYAVIGTKELGVCKVMGMGRPHEGDLSGSEIRTVVSDLVSALTAKYGRPKEYDFLHAGSVWKEVGDFSMSLLLQQRTLSYSWIRTPELPEDLTAVALNAMGVSRSATGVNLSYEFSNFEAYATAREKANTDGL